MLTLGMALIPFGVVMFVLALSLDNPIAPQPTTVGYVLAYGGVGAVALGLLILAVKIAFGLAHLWAFAVRHLGS